MATSKPPAKAPAKKAPAKRRKAPATVKVETARIVAWGEQAHSTAVAGVRYPTLNPQRISGGQQWAAVGLTVPLVVAVSLAENQLAAILELDTKPVTVPAWQHHDDMDEALGETRTVLSQFAADQADAATVVTLDRMDRIAAWRAGQERLAVAKERLAGPAPAEPEPEPEPQPQPEPEPEPLTDAQRALLDELGAGPDDGA